MTRTAVLAIAATNQEVYRHYIASYWTEFIRHAERDLPNLDVFLLVAAHHDVATYRHLGDHVIVDPLDDLTQLVPRRMHQAGLPSILSKTIHAFDVLADDYDVFFRTNLSSVIRATALVEFVQSRPDLGYAGGMGWPDALRDNLVTHHRIGPGKNVETIGELDHHPGNTFLSGSGFFVGSAEAADLVAHRADLAWGLPDDVAIGLRLDHHELLPGFSHVIPNETPIAEMLDRIERTSAIHVRLQHLRVERARVLWRYLARSSAWR